MKTLLKQNMWWFHRIKWNTKFYFFKEKLNFRKTYMSVCNIEVYGLDFNLSSSVVFLIHDNLLLLRMCHRDCLTVLSFVSTSFLFSPSSSRLFIKVRLYKVVWNNLKQLVRLTCNKTIALVGRWHLFMQNSF